MRIRVEYEKGKEIKYLSHLQLMRLVERVLRRANVPYALSEGFSPHIKLSLGTVLPVGVWGIREYFDLELISQIPPIRFVEEVNRVAPVGFKVRRARRINDKTPSLQTQVNAALYCFLLKRDVTEEQVRQVTNELMHEESLVVRKRGSEKGEKDLRPGIYGLSYSQTESGLTILAQVSSGSKQNVRPDELVECLERRGLAGAIVDICRLANYVKEDGSFASPLELEKV